MTVAHRTLTCGCQYRNATARRPELWVYTCPAHNPHRGCGHDGNTGSGERCWRCRIAGRTIFDAQL